jgi:hypothetical protein
METTKTPKKKATKKTVQVAAPVVSTNTIFVQIASYRDPQLIPTLKSLIDNADFPKLLRAVVCWQHAVDETVEDFLDKGFDVVALSDSDDETADKVIHLSYKGATVELIDLHYLKTHGACWARNKIQQHYGQEKYTLQLDSHHRFIESWDSVMIEMLESVRDVSPKPLLTAYISSFDPENDPGARILEPWKMDFDRFIPEGAVFFRPSTIDEWKELDKPMLSRFYSGHYAFGDGSFAVEVQHDPQYFFHGEEISIGVRAFTHGYDMYHPHKVVAWHEYTRKGRVKVWDDHTTQQKQKGKVTEDWWEKNVKCHKRNRILFGMDGEDPTSVDFGKYGFGTTRTLKQFEEFAGMSFKYRGVQQKVLDRVAPTLDYKTYTSEEEWKNSISRSNDVRICVHKNDLKYTNTDGVEEILSDLDFCYVGTHDANGVEIYRKDLDENEIAGYLKNDWIDYRFIFMCDPSRIATTYTVWPHSKTKGWGNKIERTADS